MPFAAMNFETNVRAALRVLWVLLALGTMCAPTFAADVEPIVSTTPMEFEVEDTGVHGQLAVAPEILSADTPNDLVFTITEEPLYGRVGLAGGE